MDLREKTIFHYLRLWICRDWYFLFLLNIFVDISRCMFTSVSNFCAWNADLLSQIAQTNSWIWVSKSRGVTSASKPRLFVRKTYIYNFSVAVRCVLFYFFENDKISRDYISGLSTVNSFDGNQISIWMFVFLCVRLLRYVVLFLKVPKFLRGAHGFVYMQVENCEAPTNDCVFATFGSSLTNRFHGTRFLLVSNC